jgi:nucleotide-binding universal stress UspA family protein
MTTMSFERTAASSVFARVLAGVDDSDTALNAALQADRLVAPEGALELAAAVYLIDASLQHWSTERIQGQLEREAGPWLNKAAGRVGPRATTRLLNGPAKQALLDEAKRFGATLIAVGSHDHSRLSELLIGGVTGPLLHEAGCSVLVARPPVSAGAFPLNVVVGIDGSASSFAALAVAEYLSERFHVPLRVIHARHGHIDVVRAQLETAQVELTDGGAVEALVQASETTDLVVVGSRGLHGLRTVGSVSERVAHNAHSSVLVVRTPAIG